MIESIMFFGGGFLVASLIALILISFVHHRAVRLTQRRLENAIPVSLTEIQAEKDLLRAEFAVTARRLESSVEQLKAKATAQLGEIARKSEAINRLKTELTAKIAETDQLDATAKSLGSKLHDIEQRYAAKTAAVESTTRMLAAKQAELATALHEINGHRLETDTQRVEIAVLKTQAEQFRSQVEELQLEAQDAARRLFDERVAVSTATKELEAKRQAVDMLRPQVAQLESEFAAQALELEDRNRRINGLEQRGAELQRQIEERDLEIRSLRDELARSRNLHDAETSRLQGEQSDLERRLEAAKAALASHAVRISDFESQGAEQDRLLAERDAAIERLDAEKNSLDGLLQTANHTLETRAHRIDDLETWISERDRLLHQRDVEIDALRQDIIATREEAATAAQRWHAEKRERDGEVQDAQRIRSEALSELAALKTEADATWRAERAENAVLRDRITDIAAQVAHMAMASGNPGSSIEAILSESANPEAFARGSNREGPAPREGKLTERIRTLHAGATPISTAS